MFRPPKQLKFLSVAQLHFLKGSKPVNALKSALLDKRKHAIQVKLNESNPARPLNLLVPRIDTVPTKFISSPGTSVYDFVMDMYDELPLNSTIAVVKGASRAVVKRNGEQVGDLDAVKITLADAILSQNVQIHVNDDAKFVFDIRSEVNKCRTVANQLMEEEAEINGIKAQMETARQAVNRRMALLRNGTFVYLNTQLALVIGATYTLGWDMIEPCTYFIGLSTSIVAYAFYLATRTEYTYPDAESRIERAWFLKYLRRSGVITGDYSGVLEYRERAERFRRLPAEYRAFLLKFQGQ